MQENNTQELTRKKLNWKIGAIVLFLSLFFIFLINIALAPLQKMNEFERLAESDSLLIEKYNTLYNHPDLVPLVKEKAYKEALLKISESDSIQLLINLSDSTVNLSIKGVIIQKTKVSFIDTDKLFDKMPLMQQVLLFSKPLPVFRQYATIIKEPVVVRHAPKDTVEAALNAWEPDTLIQKPAFSLLSLEYGINVIFEQEINPTLQDKWTRFRFYSRLRTGSTMKAVLTFITIKKPEYHPVLTLKMPVDDLRAIYRALPDQTFIAITF